MNNLLKILKNPYAIVEDRKLLIIGIFSFVIGVLLAYYFQIQFQILRINTLEAPSITQVIIWHCIIAISLTITFFILGKTINNKTRFIDILNTILIAMIPIYISFSQNFNDFLTKETTQLLDALKDGSIYTKSPPSLLILVGLISLCFFIYYIYLLFIGFKTATNAKKTWHYVLFFILLIVVDLFASALINSI